MNNQLTKVKSSMVYAVGYDRMTKELEVVFRKGGIWIYEEVPEDEYERMISSDSIGSYMRSCILDCYEGDQI
jgi:hypothetical protein